MNVYDTEVATGLLEKQGYQILQEYEGPETITGSEDSGKKEWFEAPADIVIMNTCSIREHAEDRVYSRLGMLQVAKKAKPDLIVGLMGCMVEEHREKLFRRFPQLDFLAGTRNIRDLPGLIENVMKNREQISRIQRTGLGIEYTQEIQRQDPYHAWLPIMTGCNKVCTFCIVPKTRGPEISMTARNVYREASRLVESGVQWITLLGQNVNSYNGAEEKVHRPQTIDHSDSPFETVDRGLSTVDSPAQIRFPDLLGELASIPGLRRLSFTTSHPQDATEELFQTIRKYPNISRRFHLPLQSGSSRILKRMKRLHTYEEFRDKIKRLRELVPDISLTTDIIAGFSGETEEDHQETLKALEEIRFDSAFIFKYSLRPGTPAERLPDDVSQADKERRNSELLKLQKQIETSSNQKWLGKTVEVFLQSKSHKLADSLRGRTQHDKQVVVQAPENFLGSFVQAKITGLKFETFSADLVS